MESIADEDFMCVNIFNFKCVYFKQPVSENPYLQYGFLQRIALRRSKLNKMNDNSYNVHFSVRFICSLYLAIKSGPCFARADYYKMLAENEYYTLKMNIIVILLLTKKINFAMNIREG